MRQVNWLIEELLKIPGTRKPRFEAARGRLRSCGWVYIIKVLFWRYGSMHSLAVPSVYCQS